MKSIVRKLTVVAIVLCLITELANVSRNCSLAATKPHLSTKKMTLSIGTTQKLSIKGTKKKAKWTIKLGKGVVSLSSRKKTSVIIKGLKSGTAKVAAKIGKKSYICSVSVKGNKTVVSIDYMGKKSWGPGTDMDNALPVDHIFIRAGDYDRFTNTRNTNWGERDYDIGNIRLNYADGSTDAIEDETVSDVSLDYSGVDFNKVGSYKLVLTYQGISCDINVEVCELKRDGFFEVLTNGEYSELVFIHGDSSAWYDYDGNIYTGTINEDNEDDYYKKEIYTRTSLDIPDTLGGGIVLQGGEAESGTHGISDLGGESTEFPNLKRISFPSEYQDTVGYDPFGCSQFENLEEIIVPNTNKYFKSIDGVLYNYNGKQMYSYPNAKKVDQIIVPEGVETVHEIWNKYATTLIFPKSLKFLPLYMTGYDFTLPNLTTIKVDESNNYLVAIDSVLYEKDDNQLSLVYYPFAKTDTRLTIPKECKRVVELWGNKYLKELVFDGINTQIYNESIGLSSLTDIYIRGTESYGSNEIEFEEGCFAHVDGYDFSKLTFHVKNEEFARKHIHIDDANIVYE